MKKILRSDVYDTIITELSHELDICEKCLKHEQETTEYLRGQQYKLIDENDSLKALPEKPAGFLSFKMNDEHLKRLEDELKTFQDELAVTRKKAIYLESVVVDKLKRDIPYRAALWCSAGLLAGIFFELVFKIFL